MASSSVIEAMIFIGSHIHSGYPERIQNRTHLGPTVVGTLINTPRNYAYTNKLYVMVDGNRTMLSAWEADDRA
jgi:hypothetical protein